MDGRAQDFGGLLRDWRRRRRLSQLDLAAEAEVSQRHLSFVETGRATPSRAMVLRLAERLDLPGRARDALLLAAGFAPERSARGYDDPALAPARAAVARLLAAQEPFPALAVDGTWTIVATNRGMGPLLDGVSPALLGPQANALRIGLHPDGLAPRIENYREWRGHIVARLARDVAASGDAGLAALLAEIRSYPVPPGAKPFAPPRVDPLAGVAVPLTLRSGDARLSFLSATTVFGTAVDVTLQDLVVESFFPADDATAAAIALAR